KAAERSAELTSQLLAFARRQTISPRLLNLNDHLGDMMEMLRRLIGEDVDFSWEPSPEPVMTMVDPAQVSQILVNLAVNARDAIQGVGQVVIKLSAGIDIEVPNFPDPKSARGNFAIL